MAALGPRWGAMTDAGGRSHRWGKSPETLHARERAQHFSFPLPIKTIFIVLSHEYMNNYEVQREIAACLRNLSLGEQIKVALVRAGVLKHLIGFGHCLVSYDTFLVVRVSGIKHSNLDECFRVM